MDVDNWLKEVEKTGFVQFLPVDNDVFVKSTQLPDQFHKDSADRIITATARSMNADLITDDHKIIDYPHVKTR